MTCPFTERGKSLRAAPEPTERRNTRAKTAADGKRAASIPPGSPPAAKRARTASADPEGSTSSNAARAFVQRTVAGRGKTKAGTLPPTAEDDAQQAKVQEKLLVELRTQGF